jgi:hypothetical protein
MGDVISGMIDNGPELAEGRSEADQKRITELERKVDRYRTFVIDSFGINSSERVVIQSLAEAWEYFGRLEVIHDSDTAEFLAAIHAAQNIVMQRVAARMHPDLFAGTQSRMHNRR